MSDKKEYIERGALETKAVYMHGFGKNKYVPLKAIQQATAADVVEVKHGRWKWKRLGCVECSLCHKENNIRKFPCCPNCGARMDGE